MYFDVNGKQVFATTGGKPFDNNKPVVVFLHGSGLDATFWGLHSRFFAFRHYSVLALANPGHTQSEGPALESIEDHAEWLNDVFEALDVKNVSIVAHSQGCLMALEYASRYPDRLRSMSLITSGLATPVNDFLLKAAESDPKSAVDMMVGWGFGTAGHLHQGPIPGNSMAGGGYRVMFGNTPNALATDLHACNNYQNGKPAAAAVQCPVQVMIAGKDKMAPAKATAQLVEHLNDPAVVRFPDAGHMVPLEEPDECRRALRDFIFAHNPAV